MIEISRPHESGDSSVSKLIWDKNNNLMESIDPENKKIRYFYDQVNRVSQLIQPDGGIVSYEYDSFDQITNVSTANGSATEYEYDVLARKIREISPDRGESTWSYDVMNRASDQTDFRGVRTIYSFDVLDRPLTKTYPTTSENVAYSYDICSNGVGRLCNRIDETGSYSFSYDVYGNLLDQQRIELGVTYSSTNEYDSANNLIQSVYPSGRAVNYQLDSLKRLVGIVSNGQAIFSNVQYRGDALMISRNWGNGINETRNYDQQSRLTQIALSSVGDRNYQFSADGNIVGISGAY